MTDRKRYLKQLHERGYKVGVINGSIDSVPVIRSLERAVSGASMDEKLDIVLARENGYWEGKREFERRAKGVPQ